MRKPLVLGISFALLSCGPARDAPPPPTPVPAPTATAPVEPPPDVAIPGGDALFGERGLVGGFVLRRAGVDHVIGAGTIDRRFVPASTFKIPNSLIGLDTGVIADATTTRTWDGTQHEIAAWNRDHDLRSAMEESVVWWYQDVARGVGLAAMRERVASLGYGNGEIGETVDTFWLEGPLLISPREQVAFLERLTRGELPVSPRSIAILRDVMPRRIAGDATILAKTGTYLRSGDDSAHGWLVGWVEREGTAVAHFALILLVDRDHIPWREARWDLALELLAHDGVIGATDAQ